MDLDGEWSFALQLCLLVESVAHDSEDGGKYQSESERALVYFSTTAATTCSSIGLFPFL